MLYAVLRCILACMVPADIKNDHCWDLGRGGRGGIVQAFSGFESYAHSNHMLCSTSAQIHPWPTHFGRIQYEHLDKWDEGGGAAPSKRRCVCQVSRHILLWTTVPLSWCWFSLCDLQVVRWNSTSKFAISAV